MQVAKNSVNFVYLKLIILRDWKLNRRNGPPINQIYIVTFELILTVHLLYYVEIKCQLDATDDIYCRFYCMLNMFRGNNMPIIRSSRVLYRWSLPVVFGALVFSLSVWCGAEGYVSGLCAAALLSLQTGHITFSSTPYRQPENQSTKYHRQRPSV